MGEAVVGTALVALASALVWLAYNRPLEYRRLFQMVGPVLATFVAGGLFANVVVRSSISRLVALQPGIEVPIDAILPVPYQDLAIAGMALLFLLFLRVLRAFLGSDDNSPKDLERKRDDPDS